MKTVDLFSGCGGLSLGFQNAGFEILAAFDNWLPAIQVYRENFKNHQIFEFDLSNVKAASKKISEYQPDLIIGGPPCQDFSSAGKRDETLGRANLTVSFAEIVCNVKPKFFVMENVDRIEKSKALKQALKLFRKSDYGITTKLLDASFCGVPQKRKRFFVIGTHTGPNDFLLTYLETRLARKPMTIRDYLKDSLGIDYYYRHPRSYQRRAIFSVDEPSPTIRGVNRPIPDGYKGHPGDLVKDFKKVRPLTTKERSYLQTFPNSFKFEGSKSDLEQVIGNAVPVKLAEYVAKSLSCYIRDQNGSADERYVLFEKKIGYNAGRKVKRQPEYRAKTH